MISEDDYKKLAERSGLTVDEIERRVKEIESTMFSKITDEEKRKELAFIYLRAKLLAKPPGEEIKVIVYGLKEPSKKTKRVFSKVYVLYKDKDSWKQAPIVLFDELAPNYAEAKLFNIYTVNVVKTSKFLQATPSTAFTGGKAVDANKVLEILKQFKLVEFNVNNAVEFLSASDGKYVDEFDLRITTAVVRRISRKYDETRTNEIIAVYELADPDDPRDTIVAWIPPPLDMYEVGSILKLYGILYLAKESNLVYLRTQGIVPVDPIPRGDVNA